MTTFFMESIGEQTALAWLEATGWQVAHEPDIAPDMLAAKRRDYGGAVLVQRLRDALARLNPALPAEALEDASRKLTHLKGPTRSNATGPCTACGGSVTVEYSSADGAIRGKPTLVMDFNDANGGQQKKTHAYDPHLDPQLVWPGRNNDLTYKRERIIIF